MPTLFLLTSLLLALDAFFYGNLRFALEPVNGRIVDLFVGVFFIIALMRILPA